MYTDPSGQPWNCREEAKIADGRIQERKTQDAVDAAGLREILTRAEANHEKIVAEQKAAIEKVAIGLSGKPRRRAAQAVCQSFSERLAGSAFAISAIRNRAVALGRLTTKNYHQIRGTDNGEIYVQRKHFIGSRNRRRVC